MKYPVLLVLVCLLATNFFLGCQTDSARKMAGRTPATLYPGPWNISSDGSYRQVRQSALNEAELIQNALIKNESDQKICGHLETLSSRLQELAELSSDPGNQHWYTEVLNVEERITPFLRSCDQGIFKNRHAMKAAFYESPAELQNPHRILSSMPVGL
jgi:hypothetical protein